MSTKKKVRNNPITGHFERVPEHDEPLLDTSEPVVDPPEPTNDVIMVETTEEKLDKLSATVETLAKLVAALASQSNPTTPPAETSTPLLPPITDTAALAPPIFAPVTPVSSPSNGASPSLRSLFPDIEAAHVAAVITHELRGADLYKLDSRYRDKEPSFAFNGTTGQFESSNRAAKDYKSFNSIYLPLVIYFEILAAHLPHRRTIPLVFKFLTHLQKIAAEYEVSCKQTLDE